jgi:cystathionine gamma-synthase
MHSASKFIGGHTDLLLGVVTARDPEWVERLRHARAQLGATPGALEAFLALRGLRTLPVRLELAQRTALTLAERLAAHPAVRAVHYPRPVPRFMDGSGAMLAFEVDDPDAVCGRVRLLTHAKSLGGVETLIDKRGPGLLRVSVGCEHAEDLWSDLEQAL